MNSVLLAGCALIATMTTASAFGASTAAVSADEAGIRVVLDKFQKALKDKKESDIVALFTSPSSPLTASASEKAFQFVRSTKKADAPKIMESTSAKFAAAIVKDKESTEETFSNIHIDSDGAVAAVSFDFVFLGGGEPKNVGKEAWLMVKTEQGWRISSIAYSINFPEKG